MSVNTLSEIEQNENETISLENESQVLIEEQNKLMTVLRAIYEKTNQELKRKNDALREENGRLQAKINEAQSKLETTVEPVTVVGVGISENVEQIVVAADNATSSPIASEAATEIRDREERKRFKFF